jgi:2-keto-4-pentenoate hydratase/2-oxohepta-3-ene-1,7-dioic acid hydratase in catechol pathway
MRRIHALLGSLLFGWALAAAPSSADPARAGASPAPRSDRAADVAGVPIAAPDVALTFARSGGAGARRVLLVTRYARSTVEGIDLGVALGKPLADPVAALAGAGYDGLLALVRNPPAAAAVSVPVADLVAPLDLHAHHIAAGTNYPEHAGEAQVEGGPFLFPKLVAPSDPYAPVAPSGLLDYEAELAFVMLAPLRRGDRAGTVGLVLANDYTDRDTLLRHLDPSDVESGKGFTTGKSFPSFLPVGNLLVVPHDFRAFAKDVELRLYVNGELRQRASASEAIWDFDEILAQTWARRDVKWEHRGAQAGLLEDADVVPARTLILSGTPSGTVFQGLSLGQKLAGVSAWLFGGWDRSIPDHAIDAYVQDAYVRGIYLRPGDRVTVTADYLGMIENEVSAR